MAPPPGSRPTKKPTAVPWPTAGAASRQSFLDGNTASSPRGTWTAAAVGALASFRSSMKKTSEIPNRPITMGTRSIPDCKVNDPNVKRAALRTGSSPTVPSKRPSTVTAAAFQMELVAR